ncbi:MAG: gamma carbonic anhydrase family protein [Burkholderiaceae bacterium]|jgi:carbonic anhydrase/acetyltransferase-like protein (isoleucine patch superfamily)|nr:gamma carbonic anhydrase family protein [Burkholderiaceae bacterium]
MPLYQLDHQAPKVDDSAWIFENAIIIGDVTIGARASIWPNVSIRGDNAPIVIGAGTNIQEGSVLHVDADAPMTIAPNVTIGHQAMLHGCTIETGVLIGMQAIILNHAQIGQDCLIGAGAIVPEGKVIPPRSLVIGVGKILRTLTDEEVAEIKAGNLHYQERAAVYRRSLKRI